MLRLVFLIPLVAGGRLPNPLGDSTGNQEYVPINPEHYAPNEIYKAGNKQDCHIVERPIYVDKCIPYIEKTCFTQQQEKCKKIHNKKCDVIVDEFEDRLCFNVTELMCNLAEKIDYEVVDETYTVQRCTRITDRVCDTVYDLEVTTKDDFQCIDHHYEKCWEEDKVIKDRTCIYSYDFQCGKIKMNGKSDQCEKVPTKKCYDTARKVKEEICKPGVRQRCEKFTNDIPYPVEKQNCHNEPRKKCELEVRSRPKRAKKYSYVKECRPIPREVCDDVEKKKLREVCDRSSRNVCKYKPVERCEEEQKEYCFKVEQMAKEKVCQEPRVDVVDETLRFV